jgi:hypothetical protein
VLEKAVEFLGVTEGHGQEVGWVQALSFCPRDVVDLHLQLVSKALDPPLHSHKVAPVEAARQEVCASKRACRNGRGAVAQLERQVGGAAARREAILARAGEDAVDHRAGAELGHGGSW